MRRSRYRSGAMTSVMPPDMPANAWCPCQSGLPIGDCRCIARRWVPAPVNVRPAGVSTGLRVQRCYARVTDDCRPPVSADHAVAQSIFRDFQGTSLIQRVLEGGKRVEIGVASAGRKVLCRRHNTALGVIDGVGRRFVRSVFHLVDLHYNQNATHNLNFLFNGYDVERWMLKVLCTIAQSGALPRVRT
jgi:hypothetical protein